MGVHLFFKIKDSNFDALKSDITRVIYEKYPCSCFYGSVSEIFDNGSGYFLQNPVENVIYVVGDSAKEAEIKKDVALVLRRYGISFDVSAYSLCPPKAEI